MRTFILGAGFSRRAGLPLGKELFTEILLHSKVKGLYSHLRNSIDEYREYLRSANGKEVSEDEINFEEFISHLDTEDFLMLEGGETMGTTRPIIQNLIAYSLHLRQKNITDNNFLLYEKFVERLQPGDKIFTFNYDTILETVFKRKNIPFRLYPSRYKKSERAFRGMELDMNSDDVIVFKMHGSINWFDISNYLEAKEYEKQMFDTDEDSAYEAINIRKKYKTKRLLDEPCLNDNSLKNMYILEDMDEYFLTDGLILNAPIIMSPSYSKILNLSPLHDLWYGFSQLGGFDKKVVIIGFSLPDHDEYVRLPLYRIIRSYQEIDEPMVGKKSRLKIIDFRENDDEIDALKSRYRFVNWNKTDYYFKGFNEESIDMIFSED